MILLPIRFMESHWFTWATQISHLPMPIDLDRRNNWPAMQVCYAPPLPLVGCLSQFLVHELCVTVHNCAYPVGWNLQCRVLLVCRLVSGAPQLSNRASVSSTSLHLYPSNLIAPIAVFSQQCQGTIFGRSNQPYASSAKSTD